MKNIITNFQYDNHQSVLIPYLKRNINISEYTTSKIGGNIGYYYTPRNSVELYHSLSDTLKFKRPIYILGGGSNVIFKEKSVLEFGSVISISNLNKIKKTSSDTNRNGITVGGGAILQDLVDYTLDNNLIGLIGLNRVPGTVAGAVVGNAGAYGNEIGDVVTNVSGYIIKNGKIEPFKLSNIECKFKYRDSIFKSWTEVFVIIDIELKLETTTNGLESKTEYDKISIIRDAIYPKSLMSCGSMFKNIIPSTLSDDQVKYISDLTPQAFVYNKISVGSLLEHTTGKGYRLEEGNHTGVKATHANILELQKGSTYNYVKILIQNMQGAVKLKYKIDIEPEVRMIESPIYLLGIEGAGLNGIANYMLEKGYSVSGSDNNRSHISDELETKGAKILKTSDGIPNGTAMILASSAVKSDNPIIVEAQNKGIPVQTRHQFLQNLISDRKVIAVAGTHGKTTLTTIITHILESLNLSPSSLIGVPEPKKAGHYSTGQYLVLEADEYAKTFLTYNKFFGVINNINWDHPDIYPTAQNYDETFVQFAYQCENLITNTNDQHTTAVINRENINNLGTVTNIEYKSNGTKFIYKNYKVNSPLIGDHNINNIVMAVETVNQITKIPYQDIINTIPSIVTPNRRMMDLGKIKDIRVIDDYAHCPKEIETTLEGLRKANVDSNIVTIWQPHSLDRYNTYLNDYTKAFQASNHNYIMPVYGARGDGANVDKTIFTSEKYTLINTIDEAVIDILSKQKPDILILLNASFLGRDIAKYLN